MKNAKTVVNAEYLEGANSNKVIDNLLLEKNDCLNMDKIVVHGDRPLFGAVKISGAKNAVLPVMAATLLAPGKYSIKNVPDL